MMSLALRNVAVCFAHSEIICSANCEFDASHQVNVKQSLTAAAISHAAGVFHIEDISLVPKERISLKKAFATANAFFLVRATGLEPVRCHHRGILSPLRLPISPRPHIINRRKSFPAVIIILYYPMFVNRFVLFTLTFRTGRRSGAPVRASYP